MIKVLMIGNHPSNKGGMTSVINQIRNHRWTDEGIELSFIPTYYPGNPIRKTLCFAASYTRILWRFITAKPDIVHMHMSYKGSFSRKNAVHRLCKAFHVKDIIHLHGSEFAKWYDSADSKLKAEIQKLLEECSCFIVLGEKWKEVIRRIAPAANVRIISNGIEVPKETVCWNDNRCQVLYLGVLIPRKGVSDLIDAVSVLNRNGELKNQVFVIAGTGEEEEKLKNQTEEAGLNGIVQFAGWVSGEKKDELLRSSQILVSPSYNEGLPISILEAASYGMPIVSTDVGDISAVVRDGKNGILIKPGDTDALAKGIENVSNRDTFSRMSAESRKIIEENFSIDVFLRNIRQAYEECLHQ